jgi:drug/metabolite transporter (DMT)-like permease|tara:strand:- start:2623 stop:3495 length:873 start_codon:yes stop_codon:yes gene_type:complete
MWRLVAVSIIWAFSFGLIKGKLTGLDSGLVASIRLILCFLCFMPFIFKVSQYKMRFRLAVLGIVQFGIMYLAYIKSYQYLPGYLVAVFTIFTPFYVIALNTLFDKSSRDARKLALSLAAVVLSITGAAVIVFKTPGQEEYLIGFLILQFANIAFAIGQWNYQRWADQGSNAGNMAWMYLGAAAFASLVTFPQLNISEVVISTEQVGVLLYLGIIASGLCFYLWNSGSKQVTPATLAVMNNGYIPVAVVASIVLFSEEADLLRLLLGGGLILLSVVISYRTSIDSKNNSAA